jgi:2-amino-4-hydroxy-6-hydroxymethyldihydropteridine diphosphokinase
VAVVTFGLGSNLGDRLATLRAACSALTERGLRFLASSRVWETDPVGGPSDQPAYLNAVVRMSTDLSPGEVLDAAHAVEDVLGRTREVRWGPRTIDVDVLLIDDLVLDDPNLTVPHPRLAERAFVVLPLLDIDPDPVLPTGERLVDRPLDGAARPFAPPLRP